VGPYKKKVGGAVRKEGERQRDNSTALKMEEGAISQGICVHSRSLKMQRNKLSLQVSKGDAAFQIPCLGLLTSRPVR
jgi:hypothetical protein